jgi:hypothetical protein
MGTSAKVLGALQWLTIPLSGAGYYGIQMLRDMDSSPQKDMANREVAGATSAIILANNLLFIYDTCVLLANYRNDFTNKQMGWMIAGSLLSLVTIGWTCATFLDQRHTGLISLLNLGSTFFNKIAQNAPKTIVEANKVLGNRP